MIAIIRSRGQRKGIKMIVQFFEGLSETDIFLLGAILAIVLTGLISYATINHDWPE